MTVDWETIGPARHRGEFKFWPQVFQLWWDRHLAPKIMMHFDPDDKCWQEPPKDIEMGVYCSRRQ